MKSIVNCVFLKKGSGTDQKKGTEYYYGTFNEKESGENFNLYFDDMNFLNKLVQYKEYQIPCVFNMVSYQLNNGNRVKSWKLSVDKEAIR